MVNKTSTIGANEHLSKRLYKTSRDLKVSDLSNLCSQTLDPSTYPLAESIESNIPVYRLPSFEDTSENFREALQDELYHVLYAGPGVYVLKNFYADSALIDTVNDTFAKIIDSERETSQGDHFSAAGGNQRIWNSFSKHSLLDPVAFTKYYSNPWLALVCESWLGPAYRITAQVNIVNPGGAPQVCHRDYHLGFQTEESCSKYPRAMQTASQLLTLQGAVAHTDMPLQSGPTRLLPFSQLYEPGYMAYRKPEFIEYFDRSWTSTALEKGDGIFFNPALFHAAGENKTKDFYRCANLLQISSAFGKPMETIDTLPIIESCWEELSSMYKSKSTGSIEKMHDVNALICAIADGYAFPTNLDRRTPRYGGLAPETEQEVLLRCLKGNQSREHVIETLSQMRRDSQA